MLSLYAFKAGTTLISTKIAELKFEKIDRIKNKINDQVFGNKLPKNIQIDDQKFDISYTTDVKLDNFIKRLLRRYRSDYSTIIVIDNNTGDILSAVGYNKEEKKLANHLAFSTTHPSASLFKIITSATLLHQGKVDNKTTFNYKGKGTTLYKYQLKKKLDRWTRRQTLENAFAHSNNVVFGKAAISKITGASIFAMANRFGFNKRLMNGMDLSASTFIMPENQYHLAELATGFNKETLISPVHAAVLSSIVANGGVLKTPRLIKNIQDERGKALWVNKGSEVEVLSEAVNSKLKEMMELVIKKGTARSINRGLKKRMRNSLNIGGKTGSITGGIPYGKRDWLTLFAVPKNDSKDKGISLAVMNINVKKWYVKSSYLAKRVIQYYFKEIKPLNNKKITSNLRDPRRVTGL